GYVPETIFDSPGGTRDKPFVTPVNIKTIEAFMNKVGYQAFVDKKKEAIQYPRFIKLIIADLIKKFPEIPQRIEEDYHSIKDDISLVSVYTTGNVLVRGMLIPDAFLTEEIHATNDFKEYEMVFMNVDVLINQQQSVVSTQGMHRKKDDNDSEDRLEPESHKENPEHVDDDDDEKVGEIKDDEMGSLETRTEEMQTPIPRTPRSPRKILSSDKNIAQELTNIVPLPTETTSKDLKSKQRISSKYSHLPEDLIETNLKPCIAITIIEDHDAFRLEVPDLMKISLQDKANDLALWEVLKCKFERSSTSNTSSKEDDINSHQDDHQEDDALPEGEKRVKRHKASKSLKFAKEETVIDEDEVILEDETPKLIAELENVDKCVPTIFDYARMKATLNDA
ncbi:hypothetical protein Tco_0712684, partial [Tanacetum coccineum]